MTSGRVFRVINYGDLCALAQTGCTVSSFSRIGLLVEGDELIFNYGHASSEIRSAFAAHLIVGDDGGGVKPVAHQSTLSAVLDKHRECAQSSKTAIKDAHRSRPQVAHHRQQSQAGGKEERRSKPPLRLQGEQVWARIGITKML